MSDADARVREVLAAAIKPLVDRHGGPPAVADLVHVHRSRVNAWMKGDIPLARIGALAQAVGEDIVIRFPASGGKPAVDAEKPPPQWAAALPEQVAKAVMQRLGSRRVAEMKIELDDPEGRPEPLPDATDPTAAPQPPGTSPSTD